MPAWFFTLTRPLLLYSGVVVICAVILWLTIAPSLFLTDSPELVIAAQTGGIPHSPGYPLYTMSAHLFSRLPFEDPAYRINLFSAACLLATIPLLIDLLFRLTQRRLVAVAATLSLVWSYYTWTMGLVAEVYTAQLLTLTLCAWCLVRLYQKPSQQWANAVGIAFGLAVAMAPSSILFAPGVVAAMLAIPLQWRGRVMAGLVSLGIFGVCLLYFPVTYARQPALNAAGMYNAQGEFERVNLQTPQGMIWLLSGQQFDHFFFSDGLLPTPARLRETVSWMVGNFLGIGIIIAIVGAYALFHQQRGVLGVWLTCFLPYTYFYLTYGADDRETMFIPSYLLIAILIGYGLAWLLEGVTPSLQKIVAVALPVILLGVNFGAVDISTNRDLPQHVAMTQAAIPPNAFVFGKWGDAMPLLYYQLLEDERRDLKLYNLFFFEELDVPLFVNSLLAEGQTVIFLNEAYQDYLDLRAYRYQSHLRLLQGPHQNRPISVVQLTLAQP